MLKKIIKDFLPQPIWDYLRYFKYKIFNNGYFALDNIDKKMFKYLNYRDGYFIELGANDGFTYSNTLALENKKGWRGVLIEPTPHLFWVVAIIEVKRKCLHCCACVPFNYKEKYVNIDYDNMMSVSTSLVNERQIFKKYKQNENVSHNALISQLQFGAVAKTLTEILELSDAPKHIDFMSLDVENAELAVLSGLNFDKFVVKYILVETSDIKGVKEFLQDFGYTVIDRFSNHDYLFFKD